MVGMNIGLVLRLKRTLGFLLLLVFYVVLATRAGLVLQTWMSEGHRSILRLEGTLGLYLLPVYVLKLFKVG